MPIELPFPSACNPWVDVLEEHLDVVARRCAEPQRVRARWREARFAGLAAWMYPQASARLLAFSAEVIVWIFEYDDYLIDLPEQFEQAETERLMGVAAEVLAGRVIERPGAPLGLLSDLVRRWSGVGDEGWWGRFRGDAQCFVDMMHAESRSRAARRPPDPEAYLRLRRGTSGWALLTDLAELAAGGPLPPCVVSAPVYEQVRWAAGDLACSVNDLLSFPKEQAASEYHNLVMVLRRSHAITTAAALAMVTELIAEQTAAYLQVRARCLTAHPSTAGYLSGLDHLIRGSLDWSLECGRYPQLEFAADVHGDDPSR